jgi:hypothetical protein
VAHSSGCTTAFIVERRSTPDHTHATARTADGSQAL